MMTAFPNNRRASTRRRWALVALSALLLVSLGTALEHVATAPSSGHADCLVCQSAREALPVIIAAILCLPVLLTVVTSEDHLTAFRRDPLGFQGRAPPTLSHR